MRGTGSRMQGQRGAEAQALPVQQESGRASQKGGVRRAQPNECGAAPHKARPRRMLGPNWPVELPEDMARKYLDAIPHATNLMRKALLHERAAKCLLRAGELDESLRQAQEAHALFSGMDWEQAEKFRDRFSRFVRFSSKGTVSVELFSP